MEMEMQEPGDMCGFGREKHQPERTGRKPAKLKGRLKPANHIIISCRSISHFL
jgi:hypothetical protein